MDPYYVPFHLRTEFTEQEIEEIRVRCKKTDAYLTGKFDKKALEGILEEINEDDELEKITNLLENNEFTFLQLIKEIGKIRRKRDPYAGRRVIHDDIPLPPCCKNGACAAHIQRPPPEQDAKSDTDNLLFTIFKRHDADNSGSIDLHEVPKILQENGIDIDEKELEPLFKSYDVDGSGELGFEEFSALLNDLKVSSQITTKRAANYELPFDLRNAFSEEEIADMKFSFGMFDEDGNGTIDAGEMLTLLKNVGQEPTPEQISEIIADIDYDQSGTIDFKEYVTLMKQIKEGTVDIGTNIFAQAVMDSKPAKLLLAEVLEIKTDPISGCTLEIPRGTPTTCLCLLEGPAESPYEGGVFKLEIHIGDAYPYEAPRTRLLNRIFHLNFQMSLDGTCTLSGLLDLWDATWNIRTLIENVLDLLQEPDPALLQKKSDQSGTNSKRGSIAGESTASNDDSLKIQEEEKNDTGQEDFNDNDELQEGWVEAYDEDLAMTFYWNTQTKESVWEKPFRETMNGSKISEFAEEQPNMSACKTPDLASPQDKRHSRVHQRLTPQQRKERANDLREKRHHDSFKITSRIHQLFYYQRETYNRMARQFTQQFAQPVSKNRHHGNPSV